MKITMATVVGESMRPTLRDGQRVVCIGLFPHLIRRNAVVVFRHELPDGTQALVKRVTHFKQCQGGTRQFWVEGDAGVHSASSAQLGWVTAESLYGVAVWPPHLLRRPGGHTFDHFIHAFRLFRRLVDIVL